MKRKPWALLCMGMLLASLALIIGAVVLVDPFEVYHQASTHIPPIANGTQIYSNAGIAKSYAYDSVIIGSSMTENFLPSQLDARLGGRFVKLPVNAGSPFNHKQMMDMAFGTHEIKRVFYGVDIELMTYFYTTPKCEMPDYLYDNNLFNDVYYWFNQSVLTQYIPQCLATWGQTDETQRDSMYTWGSLYPYGRDAALAGITIRSGEIPQSCELAGEAQLAQQTRLNVEHNIIPFITAHPDTEFIFFFPPYALAGWYGFYAKGDMNYHLMQKEAVARALLPYDNVRIYDFQARRDWITNLDHYIDATHYGPWINEAIVDAVSRDECRITDPAQVRANNEVIAALVAQIAQAGTWPDEFAL